MKDQHQKDIESVLVIGMGRIGLPQALSLATANIKVYGYDRNPGTISELNEQKIPFYEPSMSECLSKTLGKTFFPLSSWDQIKEQLPNIDAIFFAIGTKAPNSQDITQGKRLETPEYFILLDRLFSDSTNLKPGIKLILRTTMPLGGTDSIKEYIEKNYSAKEGEDFFLTFAPERITEGHAIEELASVPKIIGVYNEKAYEPIRNLFQKMGGKVIRVKNPITAEFCKLTDNAYRSTLFSFSNEIAMYAGKFDIDAEEVIQTVNDHYERNHIPKPGFVSGYCLSKDPYIFEQDFMKYNTSRDFHSIWYYGRRTNDYLVEYAVSKVLDHLADPENNTIALLGLAFNANIDDFRSSHSFKIMELLIEAGVKKINVYDPNLEINKYTKLPETIVPYIFNKSDNLDRIIFDGVNAIIICDRHNALIDVNNIQKLSLLLKDTHNPCYLFDGWDVWDSASNLGHINYEGIGFKEKASKDNKGHY